MTESPPQIAKLSVVDCSLEPAPIPAGDVVSGTPAAHAAVLRTSPDGTLRAGVWHCTPGVFHLPHEEEETVTLIEGRATVTPDGGPPTTLEAGDTAFFPAGVRVLWDVHETVRKAWHLYAPAPRD